MKDVDLVIVGGGPSGISTALHVHAAAPELAAKMIVLEAKRYPREKICAGGIGARAFRILDALDVSIECPMVPLHAIAIRIAGRELVVREPDLGVVVRRVEFDHALVKVAIARGIEVRDGCPVTGLDVQDGDDGRIRVETESGEVYRTRAIVGADGVGGVVRRLSGFPRGELRAQVVELDTESAPGDHPRDTIVFDFNARDLHGYAWDFPTVVHGTPLVCRGAYVLHSAGGKIDSPRARIDAYLAARGLELDRYRLKQFAERGWQPGAPASCPRVLLVGEAAGIDIATGEGIGQAIEYGAIAGTYLARAFARDDLGFASWRRHLDRRHLGWQFRIRHASYRALYGRRRDRVERMLPSLGALLRVGIQDFAGKPLSKLALARGAGQFLAAFIRENAREAG